MIARYTARRALEALPLLFGIATLLFLALELTPGDPVQAMVGEYPVSDEYIEELRASYGLHRPMLERFLTYLGNVATGDLGYSFASRQPVIEVIFSRIPNTLLLVVPAILIAGLVGSALGTLAGTARRQSFDSAVTAISLIGFSIPVFWLAQILVILFALELGWFPVQGIGAVGSSLSGFDAVLERLRYLVLPLVALSVREIAQVARISRSSVKQVMNENYIKASVARGNSRWETTRKHVLRNSSLPTLTVVGYRFGQALAGAVLVETVFGWPGLGRLLYDSIGRRDNQVIIGLFLVLAVGVVIVNLLTDILYGVADPRIRVGGSAS